MADIATLPPQRSQPYDLSPHSFKMPHAVETWDKQEEADDAEIAQLLSGVGQQNDKLDFLERDLDTGEKAEDAVDYEDISDDELPEETPTGDQIQAKSDSLMNGHSAPSQDDHADLFGETGDVDPDFGDLFGDGPSSDPAIPDPPNGVNGITLPASLPKHAAADKLQSPPRTLPSSETQRSPEFSRQTTFNDEEQEDMEEDEDEGDPAWREQQELFGHSRRQIEERLMRGGIVTDVLPPAPQTNAELFESIWPNFNKEEIPRFGSLFPGKRAFYLSKAPLKAPAKINPTRVNLDLDLDQDRAFKLGSAPQSRKRTNEECNDYGVLFIQEEESGQHSSDTEVELTSLNDQETIGGVTVQDLRILCEDWDNVTGGSSSDGESTGAIAITIGDQIWDEELRGPSAKRRKVDTHQLFQSVTRDDFPSFDDPEALTAKLAKQIPLDLNDSRLLIDIQPNTVQDKSRTVVPGRRGDTNNTLSSAIHKKFNFSNDDEYDRLKENSVRGAVGNISVEHSGPAVRLQWPFYKVKLSTREARSFHRPTMHFTPNGMVMFEKKLAHKKVKEIKKLSTQTVFNKAEDLSLSDNGSMLLLEYSEECPMMLSNFGMGNRMINYYRRKDDEDKERPKLDVGETKVLLPQDQSPFSIFGFVDSGQTVPTLHNQMYRAPVYKHQPKSTDFLVIRSQTGVEGSRYYLRNLDNLYAVGQEFPSVDVPGVHGRKVTATAKSRLRMLAFRILHKNRERHAKAPWCGNSEITKHYPGTDIPQNRTRMREIMQYNKETQSWDPKPGDERLLDMDLLRGEIQPEDVCLIDSMQVGHRQLQDAGYGQNAESEAEVGDNANIDEKLAPWRASKNFLIACGETAMIALHGEGDPTGRGEGFSFAKISMKGGFQALGESTLAKMAAEKKRKETGHNYNVNDQKEAYKAAIRRIWNAQEQSLSSNVEPDLDVEMGGVDDQHERDNSMAQGRTPRSEAATPAAFSRRGDDETASQFSFSKLSASGGNSRGRALKITRRKKDRYGNWIEDVEVVEDEKVAQLYAKKRHTEELKRKRLEELSRTGNAEADALAQQMIEDELSRLQKNKERRLVREHQKALKNGLTPGGTTPGSPTATGTSKAPGQTQRKCANCGQHGHIKTNKKLCPLLNGTWPNGVPPSAGGDSSGTPAATPDGAPSATPSHSLTGASPAHLPSSFPF